MRLDNKVAIVSGATHGMGEAEARLFAEEGAKVVVVEVLGDLAELNATTPTNTADKIALTPLRRRIPPGCHQRIPAVKERYYGSLQW
jgi:NAD(P)-dependent dehydrogenase (short-subunit alcohol dehydrogenase family)